MKPQADVGGLSRARALNVFPTSIDNHHHAWVPRQGPRKMTSRWEVRFRPTETKGRYILPQWFEREI